jgi:hypothetical protein
LIEQWEGTSLLLKEGLMKNLVFALLMVFAAPMVLVSCNGNKGGGGTAAAPVGPQGVPSAIVQVRGEALPQGTCPPNFGMKDGTCLKAVGINGYCDPGQFMTRFGCLPQGPCAPGKAAYENSCVQVTRNYDDGYRN